MFSKVPVLGKVIQIQRDLRKTAEETVELLRNGGGEKLRRACEANKAAK